MAYFHSAICKINAVIFYFFLRLTFISLEGGISLFLFQRISKRPVLLTLFKRDFSFHTFLVSCAKTQLLHT